VTTFSSQVYDDPVAFAKLEILDPQSCYFSPADTTADEKGE
jgi:hypothetical protein